MTRPTTAARDKEILRLYYDALNPLGAKEIKERLRLANKWRVYDAIKRHRLKDPLMLLRDV